jgi:O-ureido-D-serine cyclo-ligase
MADAPHIALVTAREAVGLDQDLAPLVEALERHGVQASSPCWDDPAIDWSQYDLALLRSTWDYVEHIEQFLAWTRRCTQATTLLNPPEVVEWNTDKHYLLDLHAAGVAVVPTRYVQRGSSAGEALESFFAQGACAVDAGHAVPFEEFVVKPAIGAGSRDTARYRRDSEAPQALQHLQRLVERERRSALLQPYLPSVDTEGETAVVYLGGGASHAFRKGPLLRPGAELVTGLFAPEQLEARIPTVAESALAAAAFAAIPFAPPLYARVDMIRNAQQAPLLLELELTEPSLNFELAPGSADRLARLLLARCASG